MAKKYLEKDVLEATIERLNIIFKEFDNVYFSNSMNTLKNFVMIYEK